MTDVRLTLSCWYSMAGQQCARMDLNQTADKYQFVAIYPNGTGKKIEGYSKDVLGWNGGPRQPGGRISAISQVDDVHFTEVMLDDVANSINIDRKRVYAAGMSPGVILVYRLASELSNRIAAIAPCRGRWELKPVVQNDPYQLFIFMKQPTKPFRLCVVKGNWMHLGLIFSRSTSRFVAG